MTTTAELAPGMTVLALRQALAAFRTATPALGPLAAEAATVRRSELSAIVDDVDKTVAQLAEILTHLEEAISDWLPYGQTGLSEALGGLGQAGEALYEIHTGLGGTD